MATKNKTANKATKKEMQRPEVTAWGTVDNVTNQVNNVFRTRTLAREHRLASERIVRLSGR